MTRSQRFSEEGLTHSAAHHLLAVGELLAEHGYARVSDIARRLHITRGSVSVAMQSLRSAGLVEQDENHFFHLTDVGNAQVAEVRAKHEILERVLCEVLHLPAKRAHQESCRVEHMLDPDTARRMVGLLRFWRRHRLDEALRAETAAGCPAGTDAECPCDALSCLESAPRSAAGSPEVSDE